MSEWFERYGYGAVGERLITGALPSDAEDVDALRALGITRVLNLCRDDEYDSGEREDVEAAYAGAGIVEQRLPSVDFGNVASGVLEQGSAWVGEQLDAGETVYLHCRAGWQRSATVAAAAIAVHDSVSPDRALQQIKRARPSAQPLHHQLEDLWRWWEERA